MLEKLSNALKKTTDKIANAVFLDKNLVDTLVRDLQRALIEADVNVSLVMTLTKKIKQAALDERIKGIEKKEHVTKLLHDELIKILGKKRDIVLEKKNTFLLVGLYGAGKCVHAESKIQLSSGEIVPIKTFYERNKQALKEEKIEDGTIINISPENITVPSFNPHTLKIEEKKVTHLWKLTKKKLMDITLSNGNDYSIKVTPEHPFFVLRNGTVNKIRADEILESDHIAIPQQIHIDGDQQYLFDNLKEIDLSVHLSQNHAKNIIHNQHKTLQEMCKQLKYKRNYCKFTTQVKKGIVPIKFVNLTEHNIIEITIKGAHRPITMPLYLNSDFAEFIGYIMGDGHIEEGYMEISSQDNEIIKRFSELSKTLFNITPAIKKDNRTKKMYNVVVASKTLVAIFKTFGLQPGKKGKRLSIPQQILLSPNEILRPFIKAYFDCDSHPAPKRRHIELTSESKILIQQMNNLLMRFGVLSTVSKKSVDTIFYWRLTIQAAHAQRYAEKIGFIIKEKQNKADTYSTIGDFQGAGNHDMIPLGKSLKALRILLGFSIGEIQSNAVFSYGRYEEKGLISRDKLSQLIHYYQAKKRGIFMELLEDLSKSLIIREKYSRQIINGIMNHLAEGELIQTNNGDILLSEKGSQYLQHIHKNKETAQSLLETFHNLSISHVSWIPLKSIKDITNDQEHVYDMTVEDNHSFISEGIVVHNTTSIGKIGAYYAKRGHNVCAVGLDVHRPAAPEQLRQVCEKVNITAYTESEEKDPLTIWKKHEKNIKKHDIILVDSAGRDALDKDLITEIKQIGKTVKATETLLVMPADIGQAAKKQAEAFKEALKITGVFITRMDSTAKGGGALTACAEIKAPVVFIGTGEKPADIETFEPEGFLSRMLDMGDLKSLMEKIQNVMDVKEIERQQQKIAEGNFTLRDLQTQLDSMGELGSLDKIMSMVPGMGKIKEKVGEEQLENQQNKVKQWKHAINSMTNEEIERPELLEKQTTRIQRVAKGSGCATSDIRALLKQYKLLNEMIKNQSALSEGKIDQKMIMKFARKFGKKMRM